jgi:hypothetical protein
MPTARESPALVANSSVTGISSVLGARETKGMRSGVRGGWLEGPAAGGSRGAREVLMGLLEVARSPPRSRYLSGPAGGILAPRLSSGQAQHHLCAPLRKLCTTPGVLRLTSPGERAAARQPRRRRHRADFAQPPFGGGEGRCSGVEVLGFPPV